jgi:hypothetical protein
MRVSFLHFSDSLVHKNSNNNRKIEGPSLGTGNGKKLAKNYLYRLTRKEKDYDYKFSSNYVHFGHLIFKLKDYLSSCAIFHWHACILIFNCFSAAAVWIRHDQS